MSNTQSFSSLGHTTPTDAVAIIGFSSLALSTIEDTPTTNRSQTWQQLLLQGIHHCLDDVGLSTADLQQSHGAVYVGISKTLGSENEPYTMASRLAASLGLEHPGLTVEAGEASNLAALHFAQLALQTGTTKLALVAEIQIAGDSEERVNVMVLQTLADALKQGNRADLLIKATAMAYNADTEALFDPCFFDDQIKREQVALTVERSSDTLGVLIDWLGKSDKSDDGGKTILATFSAFSQNGMRVGLLLQVPSMNELPSQDKNWSDAGADWAVLAEVRDRPAWAPSWPMLGDSSHSDSINSFQWRREQSAPGHTCLGLQWQQNDKVSLISFHNSRENGAPKHPFVSIQHGEI